MPSSTPAYRLDYLLADSLNDEQLMTCVRALAGAPDLAELGADVGGEGEGGPVGGDDVGVIEGTGGEGAAPRGRGRGRGGRGRSRRGRGRGGRGRGGEGGGDAGPPPEATA